MSSSCEQLCFPTFDLLHSSRDLSPPSHSTSSSRILTVLLADPSKALFITASTFLKPSCRHTTKPAFLVKRSSHTVPHSPRIKISTLPRSDKPSSLTSRTDPAGCLFPPLPLLEPWPLPRGLLCTWLPSPALSSFLPGISLSSRALGAAGVFLSFADVRVGFGLKYGAHVVVNATGCLRWDGEVTAVWGRFRGEGRVGGSGCGKCKGRGVVPVTYW